MFVYPRGFIGCLLVVMVLILALSTEDVDAKRKLSGTRSRTTPSSGRRSSSYSPTARSHSAPSHHPEPTPSAHSWKSEIMGFLKEVCTIVADAITKTAKHFSNSGKITVINNGAAGTVITRKTGSTTTVICTGATSASEKPILAHLSLISIVLSLIVAYCPY